MSENLVIVDCDSTLCGIEGIDELAEHAGPEIRTMVEKATSDAMEGRIRLEAVFERRMAVLRPTRWQIRKLAEQYRATVDATAMEAFRRLRAAGWEVAILSGGLLPAIEPVAADHEIRRVAAVDVYFDEAGDYAGYDASFYTTRSGGKPEYIRDLRRSEPGWKRVVMVGDGVSDLETQPEVELFVGYGGFVARPKVREQAGAWITRLGELPALLGV